MKSDYPQIEIDDLAAVIRESIAKQKSAIEAISVDSAPREQKGKFIPELKLQPDFSPRSDDRYHINDLLQYHDRAFLDAAYRAILKRPPDEAEFLRDRKRLQSGHFNKIDLLASLRSSPEGRTKGVQLEGLAVPAFIRRLGRLPLLGYPVNLAVAFLRLPKQIRDQRQFADYVTAQNQQIADFINAVSARVTEFRDGISRLDQQVVDINKQIEAAHQELGSRIEVNKEIFLARIETEAARGIEMRQLISEQRQSISTFQSKLQTEMERLQLGLQHARSELTLHKRSHEGFVTRPSDVPSSQETISTETHTLDSLYAALEDRFRGTRAEIKDQFKHYLSYIDEAASVLDLGCGRGEWLEILREAGVSAKGVDQNRVQVEQCRALGLEVVEDDIIEHVRGLEDASIGAITGFHIVEHLSIENLVGLLTEVIRVLRPGGLVIFETPNPENVLVGSNFFYMDPTHRNPLPSQLMEFLLQDRGFHPIQVLNLHPWDSGKVKGDSDVADRINAYFYGPMDYGILGWKLGS